MSNFKFYTPNKITSAGAIQIFTGDPLGLTSGFLEGTVSSIIDRDRNNTLIWSAGAGTFTAVRGIISTSVINSIALQNHNFKYFQINIDDTTVTLLNDNTSTSVWNAYTDTSTIIHFATTTATNIDLILGSTTSGGDRSLGQFIIMNEVYELPNNPNFSDYKPSLLGLKNEKKMSDNGIANYEISEKFQAKIKLNFVPGSVTSSLRGLYLTNTAYSFVPFSTATSWDGDIYEVNWTGKYMFKQPNINQRSVPYYKGEMLLKETAS